MGIEIFKVDLGLSNWVGGELRFRCDDNEGFFEEYDKIQGHFFEKSLQSYDPISTLQEYMLKSRGELPEYHIFEEMNLFSGFILIDKIKIEEKNFISKKKLMKSLAKKALVYVDKKSKPKK